MADLKRQLWAAIKTASKERNGRAGFIASARMGPKTYSQLMDYLYGRVESAPWEVDEGKDATAKRATWAGILGRVGDVVRWKFDDVAKACNFDFKEYESARPQRRAMLDQLDPMVKAKILTGVASHDDRVTKAYQLILDVLVGSLSPEWRCDHQPPMDAATLLKAVSFRDMSNVLHVSLGVARASTRENLGVAFVPLYGLKCEMAAVYLRSDSRDDDYLTGVSASEVSSANLTWRGMFEPKAKVAFHCIHNDIGFFHLVGHRRRQEAQIKPNEPVPDGQVVVVGAKPSADAGGAFGLNPVAKSMEQKVALSKGQTQIFVSDALSCGILLNKLGGPYLDSPDVYDYVSFSPEANEHPPQCSICFAFRYEPSLMYVLKKAVADLYEWCSYDMAFAYFELLSGRSEFPSSKFRDYFSLDWSAIPRRSEFKTFGEELRRSLQAKQMHQHLVGFEEWRRGLP